MAIIRKRAEELHRPTEAEMKRIRENAAKQPDTSDIPELSPEEIAEMKPGVPLTVLIAPELARYVAQNMSSEELAQAVAALIQQHRERAQAG